mgnify:CR=1 FL=1
MDKWTLEEAKKDYRKLNPSCETCEFMKLNWTENYPYISIRYRVCMVKEMEIKDTKKAKECKYYTVEL